MSMTILALETSCDETSAAVVRYARGKFEVLANAVSSQIEIHKKYGGVVPEVAARKQVELIIPVIEEALIKARRQEGRKAGNNIDSLIHTIDVLAVTAGPGLMIALSVGVETARTLAAVWKKPLVAVNHLEGHLYSALLPAPQVESQKLTLLNPASRVWLEPQFNRVKNEKVVLKFPAIGLIVSGGHTELVLVKDYLKHTLLGRTRDDAAGEAYDKVAKLLGLGYPGGPIIDKLAREGNPQSFKFPRGMIASGDYDFSFSGLKTAVLYTLRDLGFERRKTKDERRKLTHNVCASFQAAVVDVLVAKALRAAEQYQAKTILLGGGVAANSQLRKQLIAHCTGAINRTPTVLIPHLSYTTDNAAMIAATAAFHAARKDFTPWQKLKADPALSL